MRWAILKVIRSFRKYTYVYVTYVVYVNCIGKLEALGGQFRGRFQILVIKSKGIRIYVRMLFIFYYLLTANLGSRQFSLLRKKKLAVKLQMANFSWRFFSSCENSFFAYAFFFFPYTTYNSSKFYFYIGMHKRPAFY